VPWPASSQKPAPPGAATFKGFESVGFSLPWGAKRRNSPVFKQDSLSIAVANTIGYDGTAIFSTIFRRESQRLRPRKKEK
jgi:hypothetical protein